MLRPQTVGLSSYPGPTSESAIELDLDTLFVQTFLTADQPGIGGVAKANPQDFVVTEIPLYAPSGEGEHVWLRLQKTNLDANTMIDRVAQRFDVPRADVGLAGLKDKDAITTQWVSVASKADPEPFLGTWDEHIQVLEATRHTNKIKMGHLEANHFLITLRDVLPGAATRAREVLNTLQHIGVPNYYGPQRFGYQRRTFIQGWQAIARGELTPFLRKNKRIRILSLNAVQSAVFNYILNQRILSGTLATALNGDILEKHAGGLHRVDLENQSLSQALISQGHAVPTGPMMASRMLRPTADVAQLEDQALAAFQLDEAMFERRRSELRGERRPLAVRTQNLTLEEIDDSTLRVGFSLPSGSYATVLLRELMKNDAFNGPSM